MPAPVSSRPTFILQPTTACYRLYRSSLSSRRTTSCSMQSPSTSRATSFAHSPFFLFFPQLDSRPKLRLPTNPPPKIPPQKKQHKSLPSPTSPPQPPHPSSSSTTPSKGSPPKFLQQSCRFWTPDSAPRTKKIALRPLSSSASTLSAPESLSTPAA